MTIVVVRRENKDVVDSLTSNIILLTNMGRDARKPVFGVSDKVRFKPVCSATETS